MSPEFTLSHVLKIQLIIRTECFYIVLRNKKMYSKRQIKQCIEK